MKNDKVTTITVSVVSIYLACYQSIATADIEVSEKAAPIMVGIPLYPPEAQEKKLEGEVCFSFELQKDGRAERIKITRSIPSGIFEESAIAALKKSLFKPKFVNGIAIDGVLQSYCMPFKQNKIDMPIEQNLAVIKFGHQYPIDAALAEIGGKVCFALTIDVDGKASEIVMLSAEPQYVFDASAKAALNEWRFSILNENGVPKAYRKDRFCFEYVPKLPGL